MSTLKLKAQCEAKTLEGYACALPMLGGTVAVQSRHLLDSTDTMMAHCHVVNTATVQGESG